jgi:hypothetical protein
MYVGVQVTPLPMPAALPTAVPSGSTVIYSCPRNGDNRETWATGNFEVGLRATAGRDDCQGSNTGTATVLIEAQSTVTVVPATSPAAAICEDSTDLFVNVGFIVIAEDVLTVPDSVQATNGQICTLPSHPPPGKRRSNVNGERCQLTTFHCTVAGISPKRHFWFHNPPTLPASVQWQPLAVIALCSFMQSFDGGRIQLMRLTRSSSMRFCCPPFACA